MSIHCALRLVLSIIHYINDQYINATEELPDQYLDHTMFVQ